MKSESVSLTGKIIDMNKGICKVEADFNGTKFYANCKISGKMQKNRIKITIGDIVEIEISVYDQSEQKTGRIVRRK